MKPITQTHIAYPGLAVVEVIAGDEETATAVAEQLGTLWLSTGPSHPWRVPGEPGVRVRAYVDTRQDAGRSATEPVSG